MRNAGTRLQVVGDTHLPAGRKKISLLEVYAPELEKHGARAQAANAMWPNVSAERYARDRGKQQGMLAR